MGGNPAIGICIQAPGGGSVAITSDVPPPPADDTKWQDSWSAALNADVLVAHLSTVPLTELRKLTGLDASDDRDAKELARIHERLVATDELATDRMAKDSNLRGQLEFALWLRSAQGKETASLLGPVPDEWALPSDHSYLRGLVRWATAFRKARDRETGVFVVGELSEELGTLRTKVAERLNDHIFKRAEVHALTADVGLRISVRGAVSNNGLSSTKVLCTTCALDNDRVTEERFHRPEYMHEVCVKGENEGIFYGCSEHNPTRSAEPVFLERLERFDLFGR